ncbi:MAG: hypothetical protein ABIF17_01665, partial [Patescibacteria group bacterium]
MQDVKQILIKDDKGQFKTVNLADDRQQATDNRQQGASNRQAEPKKFTPPKFYINITDEEEADKFRSKESDMIRRKKDELLKKEADLFLVDLQQDVGLERDKIKKIIISYLRGIRTSLEFSEILRREKNKGGFGFTEEETATILKKLKTKKIFFDGLNFEKIKNIENEKSVEEKTETKENNTSAIDLEQQEIKKQEQEERVVQKPLIKNEQNKIPIVKTEDIKPPEKVINTEPIRKIIIEEDQDKRTKGPIEELKELTIEEFKDFGATATERVNRVYNKISLLEEESIDKKTHGINAWKSSEVYKEYVLVGEESLAEDKPIADIIIKRNKLSAEEFNAIA